MFERFTERARQVVVLAQDEARALKHNYIGTEHLLLGLLREEQGLAARVLESLGVTVEEVRIQVARIVGQGDELAMGQIPFTPRSKKILELSLREALSLGHDYIGTEHLLLGLARETRASPLASCSATGSTPTRSETRPSWCFQARRASSTSGDGNRRMRLSLTSVTPRSHLKAGACHLATGSGGGARRAWHSQSASSSAG